ncbi:hypothetical protein BX070DRAFT_228602 [Coemansia spiralis]|nr:hypothetical protein BX070DRAFT_228602 [Coemansia spiralis]
MYCTLLPPMATAIVVVVVVVMMIVCTVVMAVVMVVVVVVPIAGRLFINKLACECNGMCSRSLQHIVSREAKHAERMRVAGARAVAAGACSIFGPMCIANPPVVHFSQL